MQGPAQEILTRAATAKKGGVRYVSDGLNIIHLSLETVIRAKASV